MFTFPWIQDKARSSCRRITSYFEEFETSLPAHLIKPFGLVGRQCNYVAKLLETTALNSKVRPF